MKIMHICTLHRAEKSAIQQDRLRLCVCVCVCACVRACVRACDDDIVKIIHVNTADVHANRAE